MTISGVMRCWSCGGQVAIDTLLDGRADPPDRSLYIIRRARFAARCLAANCHQSGPWIHTRRLAIHHWRLICKLYSPRECPR